MTVPVAGLEGTGSAGGLEQWQDGWHSRGGLEGDGRGGQGGMEGIES